MNTKTEQNHVSASTDAAVGSEENHGSACTDKNIGLHVSDYIVDRLSEAKAQAVEDHLLECLHCHERYFAVLQHVATLRDNLVVGNGHFDHAEEIAALLDLKKTGHS